MSATSPRARPRRLIIHAGTHKTASTDIQCRLRRSASLLAEQGIVYSYPDKDTWHFKQLSKAMSRDCWTPWHTYLQRWRDGESDVLISAEQFAPRLTQTRTIRTLRAIAKEHGFELTIVIFIRSQLDYINSRYGYSLKRFYHSKTFVEYVNDALAGQPPAKGISGGHCEKRSDIFDFWNYFSALLQERNQGLDVRFIPFRQTHSDPFVQLLQTLGLDPALAWARRRDGSLNQRTGPRGTWLARALSERLRRHGIAPGTISGSTAIIPAEASFRRWDDGSFWGFDPVLAQHVQNHFKVNNDQFAQAVWNCRWEKAFPHDHDLLRRPENSFRPRGPEETVQMHRIADHLLLRIHRRRTRRPLHGLREVIERIASRWL